MSKEPLNDFLFNLAIALGLLVIVAMLVAQ